MQAPTDIDYKALYEVEVTLHKETKAKLELAFETIALLQHENDRYKKMLFGSKNERFVPTDPARDTNAQSEAEKTPADQEVAGAEQQSNQESSCVRTKKIWVPKEGIPHRRRNTFAPHLTRITSVIEPDHVPEGSIRLPDEVTRQLEYKPAEYIVKETIRRKYLVPRLSEEEPTRIIIAPLPVQAIFKCIAGPGLLAQILIDKFLDHLPGYRQIQRFERSGISIAYSTLITWIGHATNLLKVLYDALRKELIQSDYLQADETKIKVLDNNKAGKKIHQGFFWVYHNSIEKLVYFDYQKSRSKEGPKDILSKFKGHLQTDGYEVYDEYDKREDIVQLNCMAHARRYFVEALKTDKHRAEYALGEMQQLYAIERKCKGFSYDKRKEIRLEESIPILKSLGNWMQEQVSKVTPQSPIGKALNYNINRWEKLCRYTQDGMLLIDNNLIENALRLVSLGRKNYMFCGSEEGAKRAAIMYSLLGCCKMHSVHPYEWLKDVLTRLPMHPINRVKELLPHHWKILHTTISNST
jgi:transposase